MFSVCNYVCVCVLHKDRTVTRTDSLLLSQSMFTTNVASMHSIHACMQMYTYIYCKTHLLWCPEPVWPSAGMSSQAGNVWAMKACVYAGCSRPSPARGKTDTSIAPFTHHLSPSPPNPQNDLFSPPGLWDIFLLHRFYFYLSCFFPSYAFPLILITEFGWNLQ